MSCNTHCRIYAHKHFPNVGLSFVELCNSFHFWMVINNRHCWVEFASWKQGGYNMQAWASNKKWQKLSNSHIVNVLHYGLMALSNKWLNQTESTLTFGLANYAGWFCWEIYRVVLWRNVTLKLWYIIKTPKLKKVHAW